jgi:hypothetical protein
LRISVSFALRPSLSTYARSVSRSRGAAIRGGAEARCGHASGRLRFPRKGLRAATDASRGRIRDPGGTMTETLPILAAATLMVLAAVKKRRLAWRSEPRCRHCRRERRYCSCPGRATRA